LVDAYLRLGRPEAAQHVAAQFLAGARAKGPPWAPARPPRGPGLLGGDAAFTALFEEALELHAQTPDAFETARTRLAYGERLRRGRDRGVGPGELRAPGGRVR